MRWIKEALKAAPPGFENIVISAEKLDSFVRLSSGWAFYDIWNTFLTDWIPPTDTQPLEILEKISSIPENAGKETYLETWMGDCSRCLDLRSQALQFAALCTLPAVLSGGEVKIAQDLKEKFQKVCFTNIRPCLTLKCRPVPTFLSLSLLSYGLYLVVLVCSVKSPSGSGVHQGLGSF